MAISVNNANLVFKDLNGNVGKVHGLSSNDISTLSTAVTDLYKVVNSSTHEPIAATTSSVGVVRLADSGAISSGTSGRVVDAAQLKSAISGLDPSLYVKLATAQTISGVKTFSALPVTSVAPTSSTQLTNKNYVDTQVAASTPTGIIYLYAGSSIPSGFLLCNGAAVLRTTYSALYAKIGTIYGSGDGSTTFNLPDMRNRYPIGAGTNALGTYLAEQLPNISGSFTARRWINPQGDEGFLLHGQTTLFTHSLSSTVEQGVACKSDNYTAELMRFNASNADSIYADSGAVRPNSLCLNYVIKA